jgi:hypothetical protein
MASEHGRDSRMAPELSGHKLRHFQVSLQDIPPGLANNSSGTGIECSSPFLTDLTQFTEDLTHNRTYLQPGLFRLDLPLMYSVLGRHLINKNQNGITKLDRNIEHGGGNDGGWMSVSDLLNGALVKVDLSFQPLLN